MFRKKKSQDIPTIIYRWWFSKYFAMFSPRKLRGNDPFWHILWLNDHIAGWNDIPMFKNRKYIDRLISGPPFSRYPRTVRCSRSVNQPPTSHKHPTSTGYESQHPMSNPQDITSDFTLLDLELIFCCLEKRAPGWLGYIGDEILPSYFGEPNKPWNKDPVINKPGWLMESKGPRVFWPWLIWSQIVRKNEHLCGRARGTWASNMFLFTPTWGNYPVWL